MTSTPTQDGVIECIKTVFDPEFPLVDIRTMGLIYRIDISHNQATASDQRDTETHAPVLEGERDEEGFVSYTDQGSIVIDMTLTTPACPAADYLPEAAKNAVQIMFPDYAVSVVMVWDPTWTIAMIKDEDLKRMFE
ncbi:MAG: metal-sulfur cluster assembly factor [Candidatus Absconditabacterales bacterium]